MTAIAGVVSRDRGFECSAPCRSVLQRLAAFGIDSSDLRSLDQACFGRALGRTLPEDDFDRQPLASHDHFLLVFDGRLDNRDDLAAELRFAPLESARLSDSDFAMAAWQKWQLGSVDRMIGDFALAVWDADEKRLSLVRGPLSSRAIFYHQGKSFAAFASLPQALFALSEVPREPNVKVALTLAAAASDNGPETIFAGIMLVPHGCAVQIADGSVITRRLWDPGRGGQASGSLGQFAEALSDALGTAVRARLRRREGNVACQLSSGRDSSAVFVSAAEQMSDKGEMLLALTGAPHDAFAIDWDDQRLWDESRLASLTAGRFANIRHRLCRPKPGPIMHEFDRVHRSHHGPMLNPSNMPWWELVNETAGQEGASVLLTGALGNFSISAGGAAFVADVRRMSGLRLWMSRMREIGGRSPGTWLRLLNHSFGTVLPRPIYAMLMAVAGRLPPRLEVPFLRQPYRARAEAHLRDFIGDYRPSRNNYDARRDMLFWSEQAEKGLHDGRFVEPRDPTSDRRVVDLCFSFPPQLLASRDHERPIYEAAFGTRIPAEVLSSRRRGLQCADWTDQFQVADMRAALDRYQSPIVRELLDFDAIENHLRTWPATGSQSWEDVDTYRNKLLGTLALASFLNVHFPS